MITIKDIKDRDHKHLGRMVAGRVEVGQHADINPGVSIRLYGVDTNRVNGPLSYDITFKVGDAVVHDSYNYKYLGKIVAIGKSTVTIQSDDLRGKTVRLSIYNFNHYNKHFDLTKVNKHNDETSQVI